MANDITQDTFQEEVLDDEGVVLVDFWAEWCPPCRALSPMLEQIEQELRSKVKVVKLNVDENQEIAGRYGIRGIPTVKIFKDGKEVNSLVGLASKDVYIKAIENA